MIPSLLDLSCSFHFQFKWCEIYAFKNAYIRVRNYTDLDTFLKRLKYAHLQNVSYAFLLCSPKKFKNYLIVRKLLTFFAFRGNFFSQIFDQNSLEILTWRDCGMNCCGKFFFSNDPTKSFNRFRYFLSQLLTLSLSVFLSVAFSRFFKFLRIFVVVKVQTLNSA